MADKKKSGNLKKDIVRFYPTGCTVFDLALGGGFARGRIVNVVGDKSSGKSLITSETMALNKQRLKDKIRIPYNDSESGNNLDTEFMYGVEVVKRDSHRSENIEEFESDFWKEFETLEEGEKMIYALDSFDAIGSKEEDEKDRENRKKREEGGKEKGSFGMTKQKKAGSLFRQIVTPMEKTEATLVIISQIRDNIGVMFGSPVKRSGGHALEFYSSQIIWLSECEKLEKKGRAFGIRVKARVTKNKVAKPFRECFLTILFDYGIDDIASNIDYLYDLLDVRGKIKSKRSKLVWDEKEYTKDSLLKFIEEKDLEPELKKRVEEKWNNIEIEISSKNRKKKY